MLTEAIVNYPFVSASTFNTTSSATANDITITNDNAIYTYTINV